MNEAANLHYDKSYFEWQQTIGRFGGTANLVKFKDLISPEDFVIDFGAGGGFLLESIECRNKVGIEINDTGRASAEARGLTMHPSLDDVASDSVDVVISNNALEHTDSPLTILKDVHRVLKPGGKAIFVVPCESISYRYKSEDVNYHLYTWSPMCIGNLFHRAGFEVLESRAFVHKWPPQWLRLQRLAGWKLFHLASTLWGHLARDWFQVRCVARKPATTPSA